MKLILTITLSLVTLICWSQKELTVNSFYSGGELKIEIANNGIEGPTRIKFNKEIKSLAAIDIKGAQLIKKEIQYVLVWMGIPTEKTFTITLKTNNLINEVGTIYYLVEGEIKTKKIELTNGTIAAKKTNLKNNREPSTLPLAYQALDLNKNDKISAKEVTNAIDLFFDGEINFSQKDLYELINFFFDQE